MQRPTTTGLRRVDAAFLWLDQAYQARDSGLTGVKVDPMLRNRIQKAVKTGAKSEFLFGRNEAGGQRFHRWVEELVHADDAQLPKLFAEGIHF